MSTKWRLGKKEHLFRELLPEVASGYCVYFLLELKRVEGRRAFEEENEILQETLKKTLVSLNRSKNKYS